MGGEGGGEGRGEKGGEGGYEGGVWGKLREEDGNADYGGIVEPSQQHVAACVKRVEWGLSTRDLRMSAAF